MILSSKKCLICNAGRKNDTLYWHIDSESGDIWCWCNKCDRGYSLYDYCDKAGISLKEFLQCDFDFKESNPNEVQKMEWPAHFVPLTDSRAKKGVEYIQSRGLTLDGDMYYDYVREGIVFPYYIGATFVGAQTRFLNPYTNKDGDVVKIDTMPGTRLGLVIYGWNQEKLPPHVKGVVVTEGAFNAISVAQALYQTYGGVYRCPWRVIACSGSGASTHHVQELKELKEQGYRVVIAPDSDEAGLKMLSKYKHAEAATHFALTMDASVDWNDILRVKGHKELAKFFLNSVKSIDE